MTTKLSSWCDGLIELSCLLSLIIAPLFFNVHSDRVFEPDKLTLLRSIAVFVAALWLVKFIDQQGWQRLDRLKWAAPGSIWRLPFVLPILALVLIYLLSTLLSVTPTVSWAGSYQRLQGTYTTLSYIVIFAATAHTLRRQEQIGRFITAIILTSIPVALYGMLQRFGLDPLPWGGDTQNRIAGHMGNAIFIAAYLIMAVPFTAGRIVTSFASILTDEELNPADIIRSSIYIFTLTIQLIAIWWSGSRGPQLGLAVGMFAFILIFLVSLRNAAGGRRRYSGRELLLASLPAILAASAFLAAVFAYGRLTPLTTFALFAGGVGLAILLIFILLGAGQGWKWLWLSWIQVAVVGLLWLVAFNFTNTAVTGQAATPASGPFLQTFDAWRDLPGVGRLGRMLEADSGTGRVRVLIWQGALDLFTNGDPLRYPDGSADGFAWLRPLVGYGPEAMYVAYNRFYPPELGTLEARNASPDRSHNETWDALIITGIFGFLAWQWLYLSVFYYGFSWLGVVKTKRDRLLLIALWIVFGALFALAFSLWRSPVYVGVALPFGSIAGLVVYLIYYAITARPGEREQKVDPFSRDRLLLIALLGGILAHYVEIHFGIAIAATRLHFFVFTALLLLIGHVLPARRQADETEAGPVAAAASSRGRATSRVRGRSRRRTGEVPAWVPPAVAGALVVGVILATLGYNFIIFTPRPGQEIQSLADLPTAGQIFYDSLFVNPRNNFAESPFVFLLMIMSWLLGTLVVVGEIVKSGAIQIAEQTPRGRSDRTLAILFLAAAAVCLLPALIGLFELGGAPLNPTRRIGFLTLAPLGAAAAGWAGLALLRGRPRAHFIAAAVALTGLSLSLPIMIAGGLGVWAGLLLAASSAVALAMGWQAPLAPLVKGSLLVSLTSLVVGLGFTYLHAAALRSTFLTPNNVTASTPEVVRRVAEANQFVGILTQYYIFFFAILIALGLLFAMRRAAGATSWATLPGLLAAPVLLALSIWWLNTSNLEVIHADMIYKRGKEFDRRAGELMQNPETQPISLQFWDSSIGVYERALELTPREDFYYLWLGRAFLEKSGLLDGGERNEILLTAERSLKRAQEINPLNTDHTANLARLNTRWAGYLQLDEQTEKIDAAEDYYLSAIELSPQNSIIRNEYARMVYSFTQACEQTLDLYRASIAADPFYEATRFEQAEVAAVCALNAAEGEQTPYLELMYDATVEGARLARTTDGLANRWIRTAQTFQQLGASELAIAAYEEALPLADQQEPLWRIQYLAAVAYSETGDNSRARELAEASLAAAPPDVTPQIQEFLDSLGAGS